MKAAADTLEKLIIKDHMAVKNFYQHYLNAKLKQEALKWYNQMAHDIAVHSIAEEVILYPLMRNSFPDGQNLIKRNIEDHRHIKKSIVDIEHTDSASPEFDVKVRKMMEDLIQHIDLEEKEELPNLNKYTNEDTRKRAAVAFEMKKWIAPTRPHTAAPDQYPMMETVGNLLLKPIDTFRDLFKDFPNSEDVNKIKKEVEEDIKKTRL
jgi:hypothetical protein